MKDSKLSIRISKDDLETIRCKAEMAQLSQSDYITRCCLGKQIVVVDGLPEVARQLRAIGNNLNQLTVLSRMGRVNTAYLNETANALAEVSGILRDIQERGRWSK